MSFALILSLLLPSAAVMLIPSTAHAALSQAPAPTYETRKPMSKKTKRKILSAVICGATFGILGGIVGGPVGFIVGASIGVGMSAGAHAMAELREDA